jgi:hypothetical protein
VSLAIGARSTSLLCPALIASPLCGEIIAPLCPAVVEKRSLQPHHLVNGSLEASSGNILRPL